MNIALRDSPLPSTAMPAYDLYLLDGRTHDDIPGRTA